MRKPCDYDAELKALDDKARTLKTRKVAQLGDLVMATGADVLDAGMLAVVFWPWWRPANRPGRRAGASAAKRSFSGGHEGLAERLWTTAAQTRTTAAKRRAETRQARHDRRPWIVNRRERTRQLIELGGLVAKVGLIDLSGDDRALLYGAFLAVADRLGGEDRERALLLWGRRGHRAFEAASVNPRRVSEDRSAPG